MAELPFVALPGAAAPSPTRWTLASNGLALFIAESSRGLFISGLFAHLEAVSGDATGAANLLATAVSLFSAGRLAAAVILPLLVARGWSYRALLILTFAIQLVGHGGFLLSLSLSHGAVPAALAIAARAVVGLGSGTLPTCRAFIADATSPGERTREYSWLSFAKYAGYALCPGISILLAPVGGAGTAAWLSIALCVVGAIFVLATFPTGTQTTTTVVAASLSGSVSQLSVARARIFAVWCALTQTSRDDTSLLLKATLLYTVLNFTSKGALAVVEATLAPQYADSFGPQGDPDGDVDQDTAEIALGLGAIGLVSYGLMAFKPKATVAAPLSSAQPLLTRCPPSPLTAVAEPFRNFRTWAATRTSELDVWLVLASLLVSFVGALLLITLELATVPFSRLFAGYTLIWSFGAPILDVLTVSCLSVMLSAFGRNGQGAQAMEMGYLSVAGALGRIALPALAGITGRNGALGFSAFVCAASAAACFTFYVAYPRALKSNTTTSFDGISVAFHRVWGRSENERLPYQNLAEEQDRPELHRGGKPGKT